MSRSFFAGQGARIAEICGSVREDMFRIMEYRIEPVDRVALARECRERMAEAAKILSRYGHKRVRGAADELHRTLAVALRTIESLLPEWFVTPDGERPVELETATLLAEIVGIIVDAEVLKIMQLRELSRTLHQRMSQANGLICGRRQSDPRVNLAGELGNEIGAEAIALSMQLDNTLHEIPYKIDKLRRPRSRYAESDW